ncbi:cobalt ECF transporter T component CbiQ [archaeon SCG-AAA382B04]|nr:cobalt ECF transporter T component CbiQ [archaeon SCG-AAA382B04]
MSEIFFKTIKEISGLFKRFFTSEESAHKNGFLQRRNAHVKLIAFLLLIILSISLSELYLLVSVFLTSVILAYASKIKLKEFFSRFLFIPIFSLIVVSPQLFLIQGSSLFSLFGLEITVGGFIYVIRFFMRVLCSISFITLLLMTTCFKDLVNSLSSIGLPRTAAFILLITYRYLVLFFSELHKMLVARESRFLNKNNFRFNWKSTRNLFGSFLIRSLERGENVSLAMKARGGDKYSRTQNSVMNEKDILFLAISLSFTILIGGIEWQIII